MKMERTLILSLLSLLFVLHSYTQNNDSIKVKYDTSYIKDLSDKLSVRIYGISKYNKFEINEVESAIRYSPNSNLNFGVGVNYKWFGLGVAFNIPFINNDDNKYGSTNRFDAQTNIFTRNLAIDIYLQYYKGFYIENPGSYLVDWKPEDPYPQRPDITTTSFGGSCLYTFNHKKYSAKAAFVQTDMQRKSAGSFLLGGYFSLFGVMGDSSFIPYELENQYDSTRQFNEVSVVGIGVAGGYTHNFVVWKKLYISLTLVPGVAIQSYDVGYKDGIAENKSGSFLSGRLSGRFALVYNSEKWYTGFTTISDSYTGYAGKELKNTLSYQIGVIRFFYGRRFTINWKKSKNPA